MGTERRIGRRTFIAGAVTGALGVSAVSLGRLVDLPRAGATPGATTVTLDLTTTIGALPARMLGFSMERARLFQPLLSPDNEPMKALFRLLGPGVLRLGGNSVEKVGWSPLGPGLTNGTVSRADLDRLAAFVDEVDWQVLYGTPFVTGSAAAVADEARAVADRLGPRLVGFELANEPDFYAFQPAAAAFAGIDAFLARWESFAAAIRAEVPDAAFAGPAAAFIAVHPGWPQTFATREATTAAILTQHYYRGYGFPKGTIAELLGPDDRLDQALALLQTTAADNGMTWRLGETNSYANGGTAGVSNTLASALWIPQLFATAGRHGAAGVNVQNSGAGTGYPAIAQVDGVVTEIRPLFYGLLALARAGTGDLVACTVDPATPDLRAFAVRRTSTSLAIVVVNTAATAQELQIDSGAAVLAAAASTVTGPALDATSGVAFRGAAVGIDGSWSPDAPAPLGVAGFGISATAAATSITVIEIDLAPAPPPTSTTTTSTTSTTTSPSTTTSTSTSTSPSSNTSTTSPTSTSTSTTAGDGSVGAAATAAQPVIVAPDFAG